MSGVMGVDISLVASALPIADFRPVSANIAPMVTTYSHPLSFYSWTIHHFQYSFITDHTPTPVVVVVKGVDSASTMVGP